MERSTPVELDAEFTVNGTITKTWEDESGRYIRGVASGVEEDRDGERMSKSCIESMVKQINTGQVSLNGLHQDDWLAEIGTVVKGTRDSKTDQLVIDTRLPPVGEDAIADKAWNKMTKEGKTLGFSVGGKLRKAFYERNDLGKRRKVLDDITLKHVMLTAKPAYQHSFAEAVAKSFTAEPAEWFEVEKAAEYQGGSDEQSGGDSKTGDRNAGSNKKGSSMQTEEKDDMSRDKDEDEKQRRLACPNCGHEFAAPLDADDDTGLGDEDGDEDKDNDQAKKTRRTESAMKLDEAIDVIKSLADNGEAKDTEEQETEVSKTAALEARIESLETQLVDAFDTIAKSQTALMDAVADLPRGRKSTFRVPPRGGEDEVEKTAREQVEEAPDLTSALKVLNEHTYGIR